MSLYDAGNIMRMRDEGCCGGVWFLVCVGIWSVEIARGGLLIMWSRVGEGGGGDKKKILPYNIEKKKINYKY